MMSSVLGRDWRPMTLRELWVSYQCCILERWDHTSMIVWGFRSGWSKRRIDPNIFHPFRSTKTSGRPIKRGNVGLLAVAFMGGSIDAISRTTKSTKARNES